MHLSAGFGVLSAGLCRHRRRGSISTFLGKVLRAVPKVLGIVKSSAILDPWIATFSFHPNA